MVFAVWIFGGILTFFGALTYAELSAAMPGAGGEYVYLNAAYGQFFGFIYGWTQTWIAKPASIATLATGFFIYLGDFFPILGSVFYTIPLPIGPHGGPLEIRYGQLLGIGVILFLAGVNYLGVRVGGGVQVGVTALKLALIGAVIVAGLISSRGNTANFHASMPAIPGGVAGFFVALVAALWAYDGWNNAGMLGSEVERPQINLPRALIAGTLAMMSIYLLANLTYFYILSGPEVGASQRVAADAMRRVLGPPGRSRGQHRRHDLDIRGAKRLDSVRLTNPVRHGSRRLFLPSFSPGPSGFRTPSSAILLLGLWSSVVLLSGQYDQLLTLVIFPSWILYGMTAASLIVLRYKQPNLERPYRVIGYPVVPVVFVFVAIALLYSTLRQSPRESGIGLSVIGAGLPFYFFWRNRESGPQRSAAGIRVHSQKTGQLGTFLFCFPNKKLETL